MNLILKDAILERMVKALAEAALSGRRPDYFAITFAEWEELVKSMPELMRYGKAVGMPSRYFRKYAQPAFDKPGVTMAARAFFDNVPVYVIDGEYVP